MESADEPGLFVTTTDDLGILKPIEAGSTPAVRRQATFTVITGLAKASCFSFRAQLPSNVTKELVDWCDAHHLTSWLNGGPTNLDNHRSH